ncbi:MAG: glycosyltransferase [Bacteroidales bacterium]|nr:glycosyltransferase [Bacteroidales bacterium]
MDGPFFSVILPIYNVENFLGECIESILSQTYEDFELILIDDGSKDRSPQICDDYKEKDHRVIVKHCPNGGQSQARNQGLSLAKGEFIVFIDSDDFLTEKTFLEQVHNKACQDPKLEIIFYKEKKYFYPSGKWSTCSYSFPPKGELSTGEWLIKMNQNDAFYTSAWSKAIKRSLLVDNGIMFVPNLSGEDNDWFWEVVTHATYYDAIDYPFIAYRQREGSITHTTKEKNLTDFLWIFDKWVAKVDGQTDWRYEVIRQNMSKQYANLLIGFSMKEKTVQKRHKNHVKRYLYVLKWGQTKRARYIHRVVSLIGLSGLSAILRTIKKLKRG